MFSLYYQNLLTKFTEGSKCQIACTVFSGSYCCLYVIFIFVGLIHYNSFDTILGAELIRNLLLCLTMVYQIQKLYEMALL
jgi:hypothetical protein